MISSTVLLILGSNVNAKSEDAMVDSTYTRYLAEFSEFLTLFKHHLIPP